MFGLALAFFGAIFLAVGDSGKKVMTKHFDLVLVVWIPVTIGIIGNLIFLYVVGFPPVNWAALWVPLTLCGIAAVVCEVLFVVGIKNLDFSLAMPLLGLFPMFGLLFGYVGFGEVPTSFAALGIVLVAIGLYRMGLTAQTDATHRNSPLRSLFRNRGSQVLMFSSFLGAGLFVFQRYGVVHSGPVLFFTLLLVFEWISFGLWIAARRISPLTGLRTHWKAVCVTCFGWSIGLTMIYASYSYTLAGYAGAMMQISSVMSVVIGRIYFKEPHFGRRMLAGSLIVLGNAIIVYTRPSPATLPSKAPPVVEIKKASS